MFTRIRCAHSGQRVSLILLHFVRIGFSSSQYSRRWRPRVLARDVGQRACSKLGSGTQLPMSTAGPRERLTWWRKSIQTSPPTGGSRQSGTITSMLSLVGPAKISVPNTAKSSVPGNRRFSDKGSKDTSTSS